MITQIYMKKFIAFSTILVTLVSCGSSDKGELVGVKGKKWHPEKPYGMTLIPGGAFIMGKSDDDLANVQDAPTKTVTVRSFYMDETEIANIHWLEYLYYLTADSTPNDGGRAYRAALPDTLVWRSNLAFNDPYVDHYLRYPGFRYFPVVGVKWAQANSYAVWRTAKVNADLAEQAGVAAPEAGAGRIPLSRRRFQA